MAFLSRRIATVQKFPESSFIWINLCAARPILSLAAFATGLGLPFHQHIGGLASLTSEICLHRLPAQTGRHLAAASSPQTCSSQLVNLRSHWNAHVSTRAEDFDRKFTHDDRRNVRAMDFAPAASSSAWRSPLEMHCSNLRTHATGPVQARRVASTASGTSRATSLGDAAHGSGTEQLQKEQPGAPPADKQVLYRGKGIVLFRVLVRLKVFQLLGIAGISVVGTTLLSGGPVATLQMGVLTALVAGCGIASASLWYFSRRYLGEISLSPSHPGKAKFSVLDFWGRREDILIPFEDIVPTLGALSPAAAAELAQQPLIPIRVTTDNRQYLLSWRHGHLLQREELRDLLEGRLAQQQKPHAS